MSEVAVLHGAESRKVLQTAIAKKVPSIMSYLSKGKWHVAKVQLSDVGAERLSVQVLPTKKPHPVNIRADQPVGISIKHGYGKFIFETKVIALEPSRDWLSGGTIIVDTPDRIEVIQRRNYFRVDVPNSLKVNVLLWHRRQQNGDFDGNSEVLAAEEESQAPPGRYWQGRLVDISAGGAQVAIDAAANEDFRVGQFVGLRFTPMPYETPLVFNAQIRNTLPTADGGSICLGLQIVGLEASSEGREVLARLCNIVERYYQMNQSSVKQHDFQRAPDTMRGG
jgi:c-di-GMP-binding flagellar brake protein YcgR